MVAGAVAVVFEANAWFVAGLAIAGLVVVGGGIRISSKLVSIDKRTEETARQVNHVPDPDAEPTVREIVSATHEMQSEMRGDIIDIRKQLRAIDRRTASVEVAQTAAAERLREVGRLGRQTSDLLSKHLGDEEEP